MIKKIDISNLNKVQSKIKRPGDFAQTISYKEDEFVKAESAHLPLIEVNKFLLKVNYPKFMSRLLDSQYWTDGLNFVDIAPRKNVIEKVGVGLFDKKEASVVVHKLSLDDFSGILTQVTAANILKKPEKELAYKNLFLNLLNYIKAHRTQE
ncbi:MAG: hypothetical protein NC191_03970 [Muribaculaceae bacterium]|nr:hypothetical protein [Muribaculaceae bacterium]